MIALNPSEKIAHGALCRAGFEVLRNGWPDFLATRDNDILAVEVKAGPDRVSTAQHAMHQALERAGIPVVVVHDPTREWRPTHTGSLVFEVYSLQSYSEELTREIEALERRRSDVQELLDSELRCCSFDQLDELDELGAAR